MTTKTISRQDYLADTETLLNKARHSKKQYIIMIDKKPAFLLNVEPISNEENIVEIYRNAKNDYKKGVNTADGASVMEKLLSKHNLNVQL